MTARFVIGVDPGPTPGIVSLLLDGGHVVDAEVVQCSASALWSVLGALGAAAPGVLIAGERFVVRGRTNAAQSLTRDQAAQLQSFRSNGVLLRTAAQVKPWATDRRLQAVVLDRDTTLWQATAGMRHARDAARHALFCAVHDAGVPDPLSRKESR